LTPGGTETVLHSFNSATDGGLPLGGVIMDKKGNLYGTAEIGGSSSCSGFGCGTVYELAANGTFTVLHAFGAGTDGQYPNAGVIEDKAGNLYGTTSDGGTSGSGTVFKVTRGGAETVLYSFSGGIDGANPNGALVSDASGNLYGSTFGGGDYGQGVVFKVTPAGTESVLYAFTGGDDGSYPSTLVMDSAGNLYGAAEAGGANNLGTVFEIAPSGAETTLHSFAGGAGDGAAPLSGVTINSSASKILGTTNAGGGSGCGGSGCGTVFELKQ
jgi:uncharacterized repeat protein (TIGR03803 family)